MKLYTASRNFLSCNLQYDTEKMKTNLVQKVKRSLSIITNHLEMLQMARIFRKMQVNYYNKIIRFMLYKLTFSQYE